MASLEEAGSSNMNHIFFFIVLKIESGYKLSKKASKAQTVSII